MTSCPCGSGQTFAACCEPRHLGTALAPTAEALMRSRYSAFAVANGAYLVATSAQESESAEAIARNAKLVTFVGLKILGKEQGAETDSTGTVTFAATHLFQNRLVTLTERSRFERREGRWIYVDGDGDSREVKVERNDECPCGSGKKFKKCHGG